MCREECIVLLDESMGRMEKLEEGCEETNMVEIGLRVCRADEWFQEMQREFGMTKGNDVLQRRANMDVDT